MNNQVARWARGLLLGALCAALYWTEIHYRANFFGTISDGSLAHLHWGFLLAVAMLYRDRLPLRLGMATVLGMWLVAVHRAGATPPVYLFGVAGTAIGYLAIVRAVAWMGWPRPGNEPFGVADVTPFVVFGLGLLPLFMGLANLLLELVLVRPRPLVGDLANATVQVVLAKFFGALILTLPLAVLGTQPAFRSRGWRVVISWRLMLLGVLPPMLLLHLAAAWSYRDDGLLVALLDNRLLIAAVLVWAALHLPLRWSMPLLVMVQLLFAAGLARHASTSLWLPDVVSLARTILECTMLQLLVVLLLLYDQERSEAAARHLHDSLTEPLSGLPNLAALRRDCAGGPLPALGFLLLDRTETLLAGLGLRAQAALLCWVAVRLRDLATVYYLGSGQLVVRLRRGGACDGWDTVLQRLHEEAFVWRTHQVRVLPYLGVTAGGRDGASTELGLEERLHLASQAAHEAKHRGELHWVRATEHGAAGDNAISGRQQALRMGNAVLSRIRNDEVELWFQPIVPLRGGSRGVSGEVLCRLRDDTGQILQPGQFLPGLQEDRRMAELDLAVFRQLATWVREHRHRLPPIGHLSVNVAGQSLASREFARELLAQVDAFPLAATHLCFEVTETAAILYTQESTRLFEQLRERGCQIAIDDFGVGYQSFERLRQIPVDLIKIDGSFIRDMLRSPRELELVRASVAVAHAFDAQTAAEYVGDGATAARLGELGVDWIQGDYVGRTAPIGQVLVGASPAAASLEAIAGVAWR